MSNSDQIRKIIRKTVLESYEFNSDQTFTPPVSSSIKNAIALANGARFEGDNKGSGKRKAVELSNRTPQSLAQMRKLKNFFDSNESVVADLKAAGKTVANEPTILKWELHGGDQIKNWVNKELDSRKDGEMRSKSTARAAGGAGENKGMGSLDKNMMNPNNTRLHTAWSRVKNR
jgi:hypothetical protein